MQYVLILTWKQLVPSRPPLLTLNTNKTSSAHSKLPSLLLLCLFLNPFAGSDLKNMSTTSYSLCYCHYSWTYTEQLCNVDCWLLSRLAVFVSSSVITLAHITGVSSSSWSWSSTPISFSSPTFFSLSLHSLSLSLPISFSCPLPFSLVPFPTFPFPLALVQLAGRGDARSCPSKVQAGPRYGAYSAATAGRRLGCQRTFTILTCESTPRPTSTSYRYSMLCTISCRQPVNNSLPAGSQVPLTG